MKQNIFILLTLSVLFNISSCINLKDDETSRIIIATNASFVKIGYKTIQKNNDPKYGYAEVEVTNPDIPSGKLKNADLIGQYIAVIIKRKLKKMNNPIYSKIEVRLIINGEVKDYEYSVDY